MLEQKTVINLIQDLATPHNNVLVNQLAKHPDLQINLWYAVERDTERYGATGDTSHSEGRANIYGRTFNLRFLAYCLRHPKEKFVIVGWMNTNTRWLHVLFFVLRRKFNHWTDLPKPPVTLYTGATVLRWTAYQMLKYSRCKVFAVGQNAVKYFYARGFALDQVVNLPIFVTVDDDLPALRLRRAELERRYTVPNGGFIVSAGSRLIYEKGYDLLLRAIALLPSDIQGQTKVILVGNGDALESLERFVHRFGLQRVVILERWLPIEDFKCVIANSDVFVHPARFDAYGGTIWAMALGVPVIGSFTAGAAADRIDQGINGFLYDTEDVQSLASGIIRLYQDPALKHRMAIEARNTALRWHPKRGAEILMGNVI